jgi:hypothetical protein
VNRAQAADLYLAQYDPSSRNNRLTASNKLFEAAQLCIPLLASKGTYIGDIVQEHKLGWAVTYGDRGEIERALDECSKMSESDKIEISGNFTRFFQNELEQQKANIQTIENRIASMARIGGK